MSVRTDAVMIGVGAVVLLLAGLYVKDKVSSAVDELNPFGEPPNISWDDLNPVTWVKKGFGLGEYAKPEDSYDLPGNMGVKPGVGWDDEYLKDFGIINPSAGW